VPSKSDPEKALEVFHLITDEDNDRGVLVVAPTNDLARRFYDQSRLREALGEVLAVRVYDQPEIELQWDPNYCTDEDLDLSDHFRTDEDDFLPTTKSAKEWAHLFGPGLLAIENGEGGCGMNLGGGNFTCIHPTKG
jgi:hypothetical protein